MNAPIDIIINLLKRHADVAAEEKNKARIDGNTINYFREQGKQQAYEGFIEELEGYKKLFS